MTFLITIPVLRPIFFIVGKENLYIYEEASRNNWGWILSTVRIYMGVNDYYFLKDNERTVLLYEEKVEANGSQDPKVLGVKGKNGRGGRYFEEMLAGPSSFSRD